MSTSQSVIHLTHSLPYCNFSRTCTAVGNFYMLLRRTCRTLYSCFRSGKMISSIKPQRAGKMQSKGVVRGKGGKMRSYLQLFSVK